jgi:plasmid stability protein
MEEEMATLDVKNLPDKIYRRRQRRAKLHHRSLAREVTKILRDALEEPESLSSLALRGLGKKEWEGIDLARHVDTERRSWD